MNDACCETGYCASDAASVAWELEGYGERESYGIRFLSENDIVGGYSPDNYWNPAVWYPGLGYRTLY